MPVKIQLLKALKDVQYMQDIVEPYLDEDKQGDLNRDCEGLPADLHCARTFLDQAEQKIIEKLSKLQNSTGREL